MALALSHSVGHRGVNAPDDVRAVQGALQRASDLLLRPSVHPGPADGHSGDGTEGAIEAYQRTIGKPDGRVDPGGYTLKRLNALLDIGDMEDRGEIAFPFTASSKYPYHGPGAGMRAFGARRSGGQRAHAGDDLYFPDFTPVRAVADGVVTKGPYSFYLKTDALEIDHGAFTVRYGELAPDRTPPVKEGDTVTKGQVIGRVGVLTKRNGKRLGVPSMMLHFEMFDGTARGPLTDYTAATARHTDRRPFIRRRDLIDPTGFLKRAPLAR